MTDVTSNAGSGIDARTVLGGPAVWIRAGRAQPADFVLFFTQGCVADRPRRGLLTRR